MSPAQRVTRTRAMSDRGAPSSVSRSAAEVTGHRPMELPLRERRRPDRLERARQRVTGDRCGAVVLPKQAGRCHPTRSNRASWNCGFSGRVRCWAAFPGTGGERMLVPLASRKGWRRNAVEVEGQAIAGSTCRGNRPGGGKWAPVTYEQFRPPAPFRPSAVRVDAPLSARDMIRDRRRRGLLEARMAGSHRNRRRRFPHAAAVLRGESSAPRVLPAGC